LERSKRSTFSTFLTNKTAYELETFTPEEFVEMKREGNAFAEMITVEGIIIYDRQAET
jgi:hypothetical protein